MKEDDGDDGRTDGDGRKGGEGGGNKWDEEGGQVKKRKREVKK